MTALETLIQEYNLRRAWPNESSDCAPWLDDDEVEYFVECKYRSSWGDDGIDLSSHAAKDRDMELFIALGVGGTPSEPDELYLILGRMVKLAKKIYLDRFVKCRCPKDPCGFHNNINHYFNKRVFKRL